MNVKDVKEIPDSKNYLESIFKRQLELYEKYKEIEGMPKQPLPWHLDSPANQIWFKDFLWRITEEMAESFEALSNNDELHAIEELSDALHFCVELMILVGIDPSELIPLEKIKARPDFSDPMVDIYWSVVYKLGLAGNCLKCKRWKQTQVITDTSRFKKYIINAFDMLIFTFMINGCSGKDIYEIYFKKSEVNRFRQRSKY